MANTMKAAVIYEAGGPEQLKLEERPIPTAKNGEVLIRVKAFGLNHSEYFTRIGESPTVHFPRIMGIEAAGIVEGCPGNEFQSGDVVATCMGEMGRDFDGGYAEYTCVPAAQVQKITAKLSWEQLGAMPEMLQTAWGSLYTSLQLKADDHLLIRGGTSSVGLAAISLAKMAGAKVCATSRQESHRQLLLDAGADEVIIDKGNIADEVAEKFPDKFSKVLELVGTITLPDSLKCVREHGVVCITGSLSNSWSIKDFSPMGSIPSAAYLTCYSGSAEAFKAMPFDELAQAVADGKLKLPIGKVFKLDEIVEAHRCMDESKALGKIVVLTD